jgi:hypothetical protein
MTVSQVPGGMAKQWVCSLWVVVVLSDDAASTRADSRVARCQQHSTSTVKHRHRCDRLSPRPLTLACRRAAGGAINGCEVPLSVAGGRHALCVVQSGLGSQQTGGA